MLSENAIREWATKWKTPPLNVLREYVQHVFLSCLYQFPLSEHLAFKGGTALRLLFKSPRFSEDLDFTGSLKVFHLETLLANTIQKLSKEEIPLKINESKPTTGGYLAMYHAAIHGEKIQIELNVSLRKKSTMEPILVTTPLCPAYQCLMLPTKELVKEKCEALLFRKKPRDYYDLYFLIRERLGLESIIPQKKNLIEATQQLDSRMIQRELKMFLPISHHRVVSNLKTALLGELNRL